jgi:hypothetical protein
VSNIIPLRRGKHDGTITNYCFPWRNGAPLWMHMESSGTDDVYLLLFSSLQQCILTMQMIGLSYDKVKKIDDQEEFLDSVPPVLADGTKVHIIIDPSLVESGRIIYSELVRD